VLLHDIRRRWQISQSEIACGILHEIGSNHRRYAPRITPDFSITTKSTVVRNISHRATQDEIHDENHKLARGECALQRELAYLLGFQLHKDYTGRPENMAEYR